jgi:DNA recombination protein RmuC
MTIEPWMPIAAFAAAVALLVLLTVAVALAYSRMSRMGDWFQRVDASQSRLGELVLKLDASQATIHRTVHERLTEVGSRVSEGLTRSDKTIGEIRERLAVIDTAQRNLVELSTQVVGLQDILSNKQARGAFGEVQLKDLVEAALPPTAYSFQSTLSNGKRADCMILLPAPPGPIAVDAKFPLESFQALRNAKDDVARVAAARAFTRDLNTHIADIAERYIVPGETAESALLFLPSESIYAELHSNFRNCVEESYRRRVYIVSPTTLWATLNTIRAILRDVRMREQAEVIQREVMTLLQDVQRLDERVGAVGKSFDTTNKHLADVRTSIEKILRRGEKIREVDLSLEHQVQDQKAPSLFRS